MQAWSLKINLSGSPEAIQAQMVRIAKAVAAGNWDSQELNCAGGGGGGGMITFSMNCSFMRPPEPPLTDTEVRKLRDGLR